MEATKRPWHIGPYYKYDIESPSGHVASFPMTPQGIENAAHVVRAVNTFDQAREALKPFAEVGAYLQGNEFNELFSTGDLRISMADLKNAADALAAMEATS